MLGLCTRGVALLWGSAGGRRSFSCNQRSSPPQERTTHVNNQTQLATSGSGDLQRALVDCYGARVCQSLKKFSATSEDFTIEGYLSKIGSGRSSADMQFFFIDGRHVKLQQVQRLVNDCFGGAHASRSAVYPIVVLHLNSKPISS